MECVGDTCARIEDGYPEEDCSAVSVSVSGEGVDVVRSTSADKKSATRAQQKKKKNNPPSSSSSGDSSHIKSLHSQQELDVLVSQHSAVLVEFKTTWCGACDTIQPLYDELAAAHFKSVKAAQVVCDKNRETKKLATAHRISSYPVFMWYEDGVLVGRWNGADRGRLEKAFEKLGGDGGGRKKGRGGKSARR
jgi:thioredoxin-like negative regulator of GroEL